MYVNEFMQRFNSIIERAVQLYPHFHGPEDVIEWVLAMAEDELDFFADDGEIQEEVYEELTTCCGACEGECCKQSCECGCHDEG
jgi:hypothetical protein